MKSIIFTLANLIFSFGLFCQEISRNEKQVKFGIEIGIGFNTLVEGNYKIGDFPLENEGLYFGAIFKYIPQNSLLGFVSGIRYQRKGNESINSDYLLMPFELEFTKIEVKLFDT